ncbi:MAG: 16S rRNA (adenine(1518)-N(6)/adenine(1519)-N(6))-dimethyltransferase RsmA [Planctomycetota bacterium]|jgi:16S rRNA (adenine1518-N6/adenine1519-N6)-dimethyltransferase
MHTKHQIQDLLLSAGVKPNKRLGQNFLIDLNLMRKLIEYANITSNDVVLEVGCGTGSLTEALSDCAGYVIGVEVDKVLSDISKHHLSQADNVTILNSDILDNKHNLNAEVAGSIKAAREKYRGRFLLVANLPYHAGSPLLLNLCTGPMIADEMYVTVQKEVAQRITAVPGSKDYGPLSIVLSATGSAELLRVLNPSVFWPAPKVDSAFVSYQRDSIKAERIRDIKLFEQLLHLFMQHRRKMVHSSIKFAAGSLAEIDDWEHVFEQADINPKIRPQQIRVEEYVNLSNICCKLLSEA